MELRRQHGQRRPVGHAVNPDSVPARRRQDVTAVALAVKALRHIPAPYLAVAGVAEVPVGAAPGPYRGLAVVGFHPCDGLWSVCVQDHDARHDASGERYVVVLAAFHDPLCYLAAVSGCRVKSSFNGRILSVYGEDWVSCLCQVCRSPKDRLCSAAVRGTQAKTSPSTVSASKHALTAHSSASRCSASRAGKSARAGRRLNAWRTSPSRVGGSCTMGVGASILILPGIVGAAFGGRLFLFMAVEYKAVNGCEHA